MTNAISKKIEDIASAISLECKNNLKQKWSQSLSLFSGDFGILLFLGYYSYYSGSKKYRILFDNYLDWCLENLSYGVNNHTYCNGLSGVLYVLHHLSENNLIDIALSESENILDKFLFIKLKEDMAQKRYDFLHGALGIGLYYLKRGYKEKNKELDLLVEFIENISEKEKRGIKWSTDLNLDNKRAYNISLSHGMAGIGLILIRFYKAGILPEKIRNLLMGLNGFLLTQEIDKNVYGSFFPPISKELPEQIGSRLAWCYGDLGIALELWQAGNMMNREDWKNKGMEIFEFSTSRKDPDNTKLIDTCICHGTAGVAQIFKRMYYETKLQIFQEANQYWIGETLQKGHFTNGSAGFKCYKYEKGWEDSYSFLEGIAGIGLVLLASIGDEFLSRWDELLLLKY